MELQFLNVLIFAPHYLCRLSNLENFYACDVSLTSCVVRDVRLYGPLSFKIINFFFDSAYIGKRISETRSDAVLVLINMADMGSKYDFCGMKKVRKSNFSPEEVEALVSTVGKNYHILYGEFAKRAVNKQARHRVWLDVTKQVNRVSLERRTLQEVKNKWKKCQHLYKERDSPDDLGTLFIAET